MTRYQYRLAAIAAGGIAAIAALTVAYTMPRDAVPVAQHADEIYVGVGCGFDKRIIVWAGEEDYIAPLFCDRIERHAVPVEMHDHD